MENYFVDQRGRAQDREQRVRVDYVRGRQASEQRADAAYEGMQGHYEDTEDDEH